MFDESGFDDRPPVRASKSPPPITAPLPAATAPIATPKGLSQTLLEREFWLRLTTYFMAGVVVLRLCSAVVVDSIVAVVLNFAILGLLCLIVVGLLAMQRWAAYLFVAYCLWSVISITVVGIRRISLMDETVQNWYVRDQLALGQGVFIVLGFLFYTAMGLWYAINLRYFRPASLGRMGYMPYLLAVGILVLFTASEIASARAYIDEQVDQMEDSEEMMRRWFGR
jgi:hypothetical protein